MEQEQISTERANPPAGPYSQGVRLNDLIFTASVPPRNPQLGDPPEGDTRAAARGALIYGECGGFMVLGETLTDREGRGHEMAGLLPVVRLGRRMLFPRRGLDMLVDAAIERTRARVDLNSQP